MPNDWPIVRVDELFTIQQGKQVSARHRAGDRTRSFLRTKNVYWGRLDLNDLDAMHFSPEEEARLKLIPGDLLTCEGGWVGRTAIWNGEVPDCLYQNHLHRLRRITSDTDPTFALYWFWFAFEIGDVYFGRENVTTIPNLSKSRLGELPMPSPSADEQRQIAVVLSGVQRAIERQEQLIALTAEVKKATMHKLFTEGTRGEPLKQTDIGSMPGSWLPAPLGDHLALAQYGLSLKASEEGETPLLRMTNQVDGRIVSNDLQMVTLKADDRAKFKLEPLDILFNRTNSFELVGRTAIFDLPGEYVFASYLIRLRTCGNRLRPKFLNHYFNWIATQARLKGIASRAVSQSNISASRLRNFVIPLPAPDEQDEIVRCIDQLDEVRSVRFRQLEVLRQLFRTVLHQIMTAQLRVHDLDLSALDESMARPAGVA